MGKGMHGTSVDTMYGSIGIVPAVPSMNWDDDVQETGTQADQNSYDSNNAGTIGWNNTTTSPSHKEINPEDPVNEDKAKQHEKPEIRDSEDDHDVFQGKKAKKQNGGAKEVFKCTEPHCGKTFPRSFALRRHLRIHTGFKPYRCDFEGCLKEFNTSGNLCRHKRIHTGERPYPCIFASCGKLFNTSTKLKRHMRIHFPEGSNLFRCLVSDCSWSCGNYKEYVQHQKLHRNDALDAQLAMGGASHLSQGHPYTNEHSYRQRPMHMHSSSSMPIEMHEQPRESYDGYDYHQPHPSYGHHVHPMYGPEHPHHMHQPPLHHYDDQRSQHLNVGSHLHQHPSHSHRPQLPLHYGNASEHHPSHSSGYYPQHPSDKNLPTSSKLSSGIGYHQMDDMNQVYGSSGLPQGDRWEGSSSSSHPPYVPQPHSSVASYPSESYTPKSLGHSAPYSSSMSSGETQSYSSIAASAYSNPASHGSFKLSHRRPTGLTPSQRQSVHSLPLTPSSYNILRPPQSNTSSEVASTKLESGSSSENPPPSRTQSATPSRSKTNGNGLVPPEFTGEELRQVLELMK